jgi:7,8-dihydropterin-6-yl-methyl-4-(beta-D-ribofuranosyl)aminobenzene 5'-phosphate synthase
MIPLIDYYSDNSALKTEAGVSYYIEADDKKILLDLGANGKKEHPSPLLSNMAHLNLTFDTLDFIFISHIHLDHVGGMKEQKAKEFSVSAGAVKLPDIPVFSPSALSPSKHNPGPVVKIITEPVELSKGIASIGVIPRALFLLGYTLENSLAFNLAGKGIVLVIGCGHQTIELILERAQKLFNEPVYAIIGGLHLPARGGRMKIGPVDIQPIVGTDRMPWNGINDSDTENAIKAIKKCNPSLIALSAHDSSDWTLKRFKEEFGDRYQDIRVGKALVI